MRASPLICQLVLRKLAADAVTAHATLGATLQAAAFGTVKATLDGKYIVNTSAGGASVGYTLPAGPSALQPSDVSELLSYLLNTYDAAVAANTAGASDAVLLAWMLGQLKPVYAWIADHSNPFTR